MKVESKIRMGTVEMVSDVHEVGTAEGRSRRMLEMVGDVHEIRASKWLSGGFSGRRRKSATSTRAEMVGDVHEIRVNELMDPRSSD
ncbi:uncharacterized protein A4U43_C03F25110 [Asparagus officinalis]|uniref:Uncharacterized protein n=1 Tax=Asparagus officinalis TaxID=4686 RepID=A0A5P1FCS2_ASPOF|nr:uncharacterized protein A4U43_C03F25110 [Asparagus officinalis]